MLNDYTGLANDVSGMFMDLDCEYEFYGTSMGIGGWIMMGPKK